MTTDTIEQDAPATLAPAAPATELTVIERADLALDAGATEKHLRELVAKSASITEIKDKTGRDQCHRAAMELADARIAIQKTGKAAREDATKFSKAVIAREKELVEIVTPEETRLLGVRDVWDAAIEAQKAAAAAAEQARVTAIQSRIEEFRSFADLAVQCRTSAMVEKLIDRLAALPIDGLEEFQDQGMTVRVMTMKRMQEISDAKKSEEDERARIKAEQEAEAAKLAAERAELARQQAEAAAAQAKAAADLKAAQDAHAAQLQAAQAAQAQADREAAESRAAVEAAAQAQRNAEAAELQRQRDAFAAEQAAARAAQQAEAARLQAQADELARQRAELEPKPDAPSVERSSDAIETEADHIPEAGNMVTEQAHEPSAEPAPEADPMPVTMAAPEPEEPSDAEIICTAASAVADAYGWTFGQSVQRLSSLEWAAD